MKLGQKREKFYGIDSKPSDEIHPEVSFPSELFKGKYQVGDKCKFMVTGVIESMSKDQYRVKLLEGTEQESGESIVKKAK